MKRKESFLPAFFIALFLCIAILALSLSGNLKFLSSPLEKVTSSIQALSFNVFKSLPFISSNQKIEDLEEKNQELLSRFSDYEKLKKENEALSDQFQTSYPQSPALLKADIVGAPGFIPGISLPISLILNKGAKDNIKLGQAVVVKNNLVGIISHVSENLSKADTLNNSSLSFTAKTGGNAFGIVNGEGGSLTFDNVLLSDNIKEGHIVFTKGDTNQDGTGIPQDLVVGKIVSVDKSASDLFQKGKIESAVDFASLSIVFIYLDRK